MAERRRQPYNNIYTMLMAVALVVLVFGAVYIWMEIHALTGEMNPFQGLGALPVFETLAAAAAALPAVVV